MLEIVNDKKKQLKTPLSWQLVPVHYEVVDTI